MRFKQCEWQRKILQHYQFYTLSSAVVAWPSGWRPYFFRWRKLRCRFKSQRGYFQFFYYYFLSSFFYPSAFYCLFSLLTLLASRDFCENVFLVMLKRNSTNLHCKFGACQKWEPAGRMGDFGNFLNGFAKRPRLIVLNSDWVHMTSLGRFRNLGPRCLGKTFFT